MIEKVQYNFEEYEQACMVERACKTVWELAPVESRAIKALVQGFRGTKSPEDKDISYLLTIIHLPQQSFVSGSVHGTKP